MRGVTDEGGGEWIKGVRIDSSVLKYHRKILYGSIIRMFFCNIVPIPWRRESTALINFRGIWI